MVEGQGDAQQGRHVQGLGDVQRRQRLRVRDDHVGVEVTGQVPLPVEALAQGREHLLELRHEAPQPARLRHDAARRLVQLVAEAQQRDAGTLHQRREPLGGTDGHLMPTLLQAPGKRDERPDVSPVPYAGSRILTALLETVLKSDRSYFNTARVDGRCQPDGPRPVSPRIARWSTPNR